MLSPLADNDGATLTPVMRTGGSDALAAGSSTHCGLDVIVSDAVEDGTAMHCQGNAPNDVTGEAIDSVGRRSDRL